MKLKKNILILEEATTVHDQSTHKSSRSSQRESSTTNRTRQASGKSTRKSKSAIYKREFQDV